MSTRCFYGLYSSGRYRFNYIHADGYPEGNGAILMQSWSDASRLEELLALGYLSSLGHDIGQKHDFYDFQGRAEAWKTTAYHRDRGDELIAPIDGTDLATILPSILDSWAEYVYLYSEDEGWQFLDLAGLDREAIADGRLPDWHNLRGYLARKFPDLLAEIAS